MFAAYLERWNLVADGDTIVTHNSRLLPVSRNGEPAMLKIAIDPEEKAGASLMVWWGGDGAARVLAHEGDAILLERSDDDGKLMKMARTGQDDEASRIICAAAARIHKAREKALPPTLVPLSQWFRSLEAGAAQRGGLLAEAAAIARELLAEPQEVVALHGDIHHQNILDFGERGWLAIDPKGLLGERGYDFANTLDNPDAEIAYKPGRLAHQASVIADAARLDRRHLLKWAVAYGGLSQSFYLRDDKDAQLDLRLVELAMAELAR